jgi:hypothetical protein
VNEKTIGIIIGIVFTLVIMAISVALTFFFIYYFQPEFIGELYPRNCSLSDFLLINK